MSEAITRFSPGAGRPYAPAVRAGDWVYTSGFTGFSKGGEVPADFAAQFRLIIEKASAALSSAGASLAQVVHVTVYLTDSTEYAALNPLFAEVFAEHPPTRACVEVKGLSSPEKRIEMQFTAYVGGVPSDSIQG